MNQLAVLAFLSLTMCFSLGLIYSKVDLRDYISTENYVNSLKEISDNVRELLNVNISGNSGDKIRQDISESINRLASTHQQEILESLQSEMQQNKYCKYASKTLGLWIA